MGNPKQKWTAEEEEALRAGVKKHGAGKWKFIQRDPEFNHLLHSRSNIDLKDKWRNLTVANGLGSREKSRTTKAKTNPDSPSTPMPKLQAPASSVPVVHDTSKRIVMDDSSKCLLDGKTASKYNAMICEALSTLKDPNGSDIGAIFRFIEGRHEVPQNFRALLGSRLRRLVAQEKLEKIQNRFKIKEEILLGVRPSGPKPKETWPKPSQSQTTAITITKTTTTTTTYLGDTLEEAAVAAAYMIAEAENKSFVAAEAVKEAERVSMMAEDSDSMLQFAKQILERSSGGNILLIA